jgi:ComF family protein
MQRGFNQSALLAQLLSRMTGIPATVTALRRIGKNRSQRGLSLQKRQENVEGAFVCDADFAHRHLLLIDDVFTTGATLSACVSVLRDAGAERVEALTLMKVTL